MKYDSASSERTAKAVGEHMVAEHNTQSNTNSNLFKYNGKEQEEFLDWYNYGTRFYDPNIAKTTFNPLVSCFVT